MPFPRLVTALALLSAIAFFIVTGASGDASHERAPARALDPLTVVKIQLDALRERGDAGIPTAFRFASPENRAVTGPLERFDRMVHNETYAVLLRHRAAEIGEVHFLGERAAVPVIVTATDGTRHGFMFLLARQTEGEWDGCWMTDGVVPHPLPEPAGRLI